jgi:hypothetical protein
MSESSSFGVGGIWRDTTFFGEGEESGRTIGGGVVSCCCAFGESTWIGANSVFGFSGTDVAFFCSTTVPILLADYDF